MMIGGKQESMTSVRRVLVIMMKKRLPLSRVAWRRNCGVAPVSVSSICVKSAEMRLESSPTRRWAKKLMGSATRRE